MKLSEEEIRRIPLTGSPFFRVFIEQLNELIGNKYTIRVLIHNPQRGDKETAQKISKETALILWGDEYSQTFPKKYASNAGAVIKCYCPETWEKKGIIPITDIAMNWDEENKTPNIPCSKRPYTVMFSANLNYRRTDIYRGLSGRSFLYPFRISSNYPITGSYPFWHKVEAVIMHKCIMKWGGKFDFSELYPNSYIHFNMGFANGALSKEEYFHRLALSKVSWCTAGFMTNETSRLLESCNAGCAIICGTLPNNDIFRNAPFIRMKDWRKVRKITDNLLADEARLDELGVASKQWYDTHFSPYAQARYVARRLGLL
ncbi:MAG: hypothetical protein MR890_08440 [Akkermansia muciniphila]|nr:hypothetical protein [Akkermansia muciniphila]